MVCIESYVLPNPLTNIEPGIRTNPKSTNQNRPEIMPHRIERKREKETSQMAGANPKEV
jgi:hypothetical protein